MHRHLVIASLFTLVLVGCAEPEPTIVDAPETYPTQEECEQITGKTCGFMMCDFVPAGKTYEETCGRGFKKGWGAMGGI